MNKEVEKYLNGLTKWQQELTRLREIVQHSGLREEYKWKHPCYTLDGKNVVLLHEFKNYCAILFYKGVLLKDPANILVQQTKNVEAARQIRFTCVSEIEELQATIRAYIREAIETERAGLEVKKKEGPVITMPEELSQKFREDPEFEQAFQALTPGRQKGYFYHFGQPKQSKTRVSRIEKSRERILDGYGLRDCVCGLSRRMPNCDGSHKQLSKNK